MISLRLAETKDIPYLKRAEEETFSDPWGESALLSHLSSEHTVSLIATEGNEPLGYLLGSVLAPESELYRIAVEGNARRRGVGRLLLDFFFREIKERGAETVYLEVRESNLPARSLYASVGFTEVGIRKNYYRRPDENAAILVKGSI